MWVPSGHGIPLLRHVGPRLRGLVTALMGMNMPGVTHAHTHTHTHDAAKPEAGFPSPGITERALVRLSERAAPPATAFQGREAPRHSYRTLQRLRHHVCDHIQSVGGSLPCTGFGVTPSFPFALISLLRKTWGLWL